MDTMNTSALLVLFSLVTAIGQTLFSSILLAFRKENKQANFYLISFLLSLCCLLTLFYLFDFWRKSFIHTLLLHQPLIFLIPVFFWLYVSTLVGSRRGRSRFQLVLHCLPFVVCVCAYAPFYVLPSIEKIEWMYFRFEPTVVLSGAQRSVQWLNTMTAHLGIFSGIVYCYASWRLIVDHSKSVENEYSYLKGVDLRWLRYLIVGAVLVYLCSLIAVTRSSFSMSVAGAWVTTVVVGCSSLSMFAYFGLQQRELRWQERVNPSVVSLGRMSKDDDVSKAFYAPDSSNESKYKNSSLTDDEAQTMYLSLKHCVEENKYFLNPDLNIQSLATETGFPVRDVSRVINEKAQKNFMEFINFYRINEAKDKLLEDRKKSVLDVAMDVGFNSKSAFYEAFKRKEGTTPSKFRSSAKVAYSA